MGNVKRKRGSEERRPLKMTKGREEGRCTVTAIEEERAWANLLG